MSRATVHIQIGRHLNMWANLFFLGEGGIRPHPLQLALGRLRNPKTPDFAKGAPIQNCRKSDLGVWGSGAVPTTHWGSLRGNGTSPDLTI